MTLIFYLNLFFCWLPPIPTNSMTRAGIFHPHFHFSDDNRNTCQKLRVKGEEAIILIKAATATTTALLLLLPKKFSN
jgi:hypothetical protein